MERRVQDQFMFLSTRSATVIDHARPREFDPEEVHERSMRAFREHGYHETSVDDLVNATGVLSADGQG